jgi:hypothetical protein
MTVFPRSINARMSHAIMAAVVLAAVALPPAQAAEPSPASVALAAQVLDAVGLKATVDAVVPHMLGELERQIEATHPEMKAALHETVVALTPELVKSEAGVLNDAASVMAAGMSDAELKDTLAFFESPAGKKYVSSQVPILQQLNASGNAWRAQLSSTLLPRIRLEMKKKGFEF